MNKKSDSPSMGKSISIAVAIMAVSGLISRFLGFARVAVLAQFVGTGAEADAFSFAFIVPDVLNHLLAGSALSIPFIPILQKLFADNKEDEGWQFFSNMITIGTILFIAFAMFGMFFTDKFVALGGNNINDPSNPELKKLTVYLTRIILPAQLFFFWGALLNAVQYSKKLFFRPALAPLAYNIGIISCGAFLYPKIGVQGFSWGVLIGAFIGNVVIQVPGALKAGMKFKPRIDLKDKNFRKCVLLALPLTLGLTVTFSTEFLLRFLGSYVKDGTGSISSLDYSYKLTWFFVGAIGQATASGIYPFMSELAINGKLKELGELISRTLKKIAGLLLPISGVVIVVAPQIITIALQRGKFDAHSTTMTASNFSLLMVGSFFFSGVLLIYRAFFAMQNTILPMIVSTTTVVSFLPIYAFLAKTMGTKGIALSVSASAIVQFLIIFLLWVHRIKWKKYLNSLGSILLIMIISAFGSAVCFELKQLLINSQIIEINSVFLRNVTIASLSGIPAILVSMTILQITGLFDVITAIRVMIKR